MAMETLTVCRFCHASAGQDESNKIQVYAEMLRDIFNIEISNIEEAKTHKVRTVACPECISKLTAAGQFKRQVLDAENKLANLLAQYDSEAKNSNDYASEVQVKDEVQAESEPDLSADEERDGHDDIGETTSELPLAVKARVRGGRGGRGGKRRKESGEDICSTGGVRRARGPAPLLRQESLRLLAHSSLCVFQWRASRYRCFCCHLPFASFAPLRDHARHHSLDTIERKIVHQQNRLVKVEVSILDCKLCGETLRDLPALKRHLVERHQLQFSLNEDLLVPFKLDTDDFRCQICSETFSAFRHLNIHMNRHFQRQVCHICGAGFANLVYLNLHKTRAHRPLKCNECQIEFASKVDKREHETRVHNVKVERKLRFPCPFCGERYFQEHLRVLHLVEKHGLEKPEHGCSICGKVYVTKSLRNNHLKNVHMKQKNKECDVCRMRFYTNSDLNRHKVTHTGEKNFSCGSCNNLYATKDSLNRHVKRTHSCS